MKRLISWLDFHKDAMQKSLTIIKQTFSSTFLTILTIVILLILSAIFWMLANVMRGIELDWQTNKQISVYLQVPTSQAAEAELLEKIKTTKGVAQAHLRSAEDGLQMLKENIEVRDILSYLPENPLPAVIEVTASTDFDVNAELSKLKETFLSYPDVESVSLDLTWIRSIALFIKVISGVLQVLICLISLALILIITNALRLIIADRIDEINVLKFVGASDKYIRRPYLYTGCLYALLAAFLAVVGISVIMFFIQSSLNDLLATYSITYTINSVAWDDIALLITLALFIGWIGANFATRKYLRIIFVR